MTYQGYKARDFIFDGRFRKWVLESDPEAAAFWEPWLKNNPGKAAEVQKAREILLLINFKAHHPESQDQAEVWNGIEARIREEENIIPMTFPTDTRAAPQVPIKVKTRNWYRYAAVFAGVLLAGLLSLYLFNRLPVSYSTGYGEVKTIALPDNSVVKLNANSSLSFSRNWNKKREVYLEGEAFFMVVHKSNEQGFLVYTDDVTVQVLGTEFNVNSRHIGTSVVLNNGTVRLHLNPSASGPDKKPEDLLMHPGEMVSWSSSTGQLVTEKVDPELHSSWRTNVLIFNDTPIREVARSLEDNFGLDIRFEGEQISKETFTGSIPMDNVEVFFKTLSRSMDITIVKKEGTIYILEKDETNKKLKPN